MVRNFKILVYLLPIIPPMLWALSIVIAKWIGDRISPLNLTYLRFFSTTLIMVPLLVILFIQFKKKSQKPKINPYALHLGKKYRKGLIYIFLISLTGVAVNNTIFYFGLHYIYASDSSLILGMSPILNGVISSILLKKSFKKNQIIGTLLGFFGVSIIIGFILAHFDLSRLGGLFLVFIAITLWSSSFVFSSMASEYNYSPITITNYSILFAVLVMTPFVLAQIVPVINIVLSDIDLVFAFIYYGLFAGAIGYSLWYGIIKKIGTVETAIYVDSMPFWVVFFSYVFLGETITIFHILGLVFIAIGVIIVNKKPNSNDLDNFLS